MIDQELLHQAIEDAKAVKFLCLSNTNGQFTEIMGYDEDGNIVPKTARCHLCDERMDAKYEGNHRMKCNVDKINEINKIARDMAIRYYGMHKNSQPYWKQDLKATGKTEEEMFEEYITVAYWYGYMDGATKTKI